MVIMDKTSTSDEQEVVSSAKPLWNNDVEVIPIAFGRESDESELKAITPHAKNVIAASLSNETRTIAREIMHKVRKGTWTKDTGLFPFDRTDRPDQLYKAFKLAHFENDIYCSRRMQGIILHVFLQITAVYLQTDLSCRPVLNC